MQLRSKYQHYFSCFHLLLAVHLSGKLLCIPDRRLCKRSHCYPERDAPQSSFPDALTGMQGKAVYIHRLHSTLCVAATSLDGVSLVYRSTYLGLDRDAHCTLPSFPNIPFLYIQYQLLRAFRLGYYRLVVTFSLSPPPYFSCIYIYCYHIAPSPWRQLSLYLLKGACFILSKASPPESRPLLSNQKTQSLPPAPPQKG